MDNKIENMIDANSEWDMFKGQFQQELESLKEEWNADNDFKTFRENSLSKEMFFGRIEKGNGAYIIKVFDNIFNNDPSSRGQQYNGSENDKNLLDKLCLGREDYFNNCNQSEKLRLVAIVKELIEHKF